MGLLALSAQIFATAHLGVEVPRAYFTPPPKVDSQVVVLRRRPAPLVAPEDQNAFFRLARAGFHEKRKKLRSSLSGGLGVEKEAIDAAIAKADLPADARAQNLSIDDWQKLAKYLP
jgi:16S rRNA (adenine1518-N6/adenine1519-N6)-dimethyltransferase